jgi:hypothetical protein
VTTGLDKRITLPDGSTPTLGDLKRFAWTTGYFLEERLDPLQLELDQIFSALKPRTREFILLARKTGKTYGLLAYADKMARRHKDWIIRFAYPTETQGKTIILPILNELQADCPSDLKWVNREAQEKCWVLPHTGSRLYLAGTDNADQVDRLRGPKAHLIVLDELPTFKGDLTYLINSVLWPQTLSTGGHILMSGTPAKSVDHESSRIIDLCRKQDRLVVRTIFQNPRLSQDDIKSICTEANPDCNEVEILDILAGKREGTPDWEREFLCRMVTDKNMRVTPEFDPREHVAERGLPQFFHRFVFLDPGHVNDHFGVTFAALDFAAQKLFVVREYLARRKTTDQVMLDLVAIENELGWSKVRGDEQILRYIDATSQQQAADFNAKGYRVQLAVKSPGKSEVVTELRNRLNADHVIVHPRCKNLISQMNDGIWKDTAKADFERTDLMGHLDVLDSLAQGCMTLSAMGKWRQNPAPKGRYLDPVDNVIHFTPEPRTAVQGAFHRAFGIKRRHR